jgi:branched-chain amino acid transport system permease protein
VATPAISFRDRASSPRQAWQQLPEKRRRDIVRGVEIGVVAALFPFYSAFALLLLFIILLSWVPEHIPVPAGIPLARIWSRPRIWVWPVAVLLIAALYPKYVDRTGNLGELGSPGHVGNLPFFGSFPSLDDGVVMLVYIMMALGLNIVVGYAGLLDLGYVAFYAMGAYTAAWFASPQFAKHTFHFLAVGVPSGDPGYHVNVWLVLALAGIFTAIIGVIIGLPTLRLRGDYLAIVTLGFGEIMPQIARNGDNFFGTGFNLTNGAQGISPIDGPGFGHTLHRATGGFLPDSFFGGTNPVELFFWGGIVLVLFTIFCSWRLRDSRLGRAWIAIREDEIAAAAMGIPLMRTKTWAYACGAFFGGIAGAYFASYKQATFADDFSFNISVFILCMVILGGMGSIWGVIAGGAFLAYLNQSGLGNIGGWIHSNLGITIDVPQYSFLIYGIIILLIMLFRPEGLIPSSRQKQELHRGVADEPLYDASA